MEIYSRNFYNRCRTTPEPVKGTWTISSTFTRPCSLDTEVGYQCPFENGEPLYCGNSLLEGISEEEDGVFKDPQV